MTIITEAPGWFLLLCLLAGMVYAGALYFRDRFNRTYGSRLALLLSVLRFSGVTILAFFLLKPVIRLIENTDEKPVIVIAQDNSASLVIGSDSSAFRQNWPGELKGLKESLGENYDVVYYQFGEKVQEGIDSLDFSDRLTDFSDLQEELFNKLSGRNLGAVIVASDGLYNKGSNPVQEFHRLKAPVFTVALGDTVVHRDILVQDVAHNRLAFLGNKFPMEITVEGRKALGTRSELSVSAKGQVLYKQEVIFTGERDIQSFSLVLDARETGLQKYTVALTPVESEITTANNRAEVFIDVLDDRQKVLILAPAPHPDLAAMADALSSNEGYRVDVSLTRDFKGELGAYSLVIFHQLPAIGGTGASLVTDALAKNIPALFVWGSATDFEAFNALKLGYSLSDYRNTLTDARPAMKEDFPLFKLDEETRGLLEYLPPLAVPFGNLSTSEDTRPLLTQKIGLIDTDQPLIAFRSQNETKTGLIAGEGLWRWRLADYQEGETHDRFDALFTLVAQYLASKEDRSLFRVTGNHQFLENEEVLFDAELYNASFQPVTDKEISMRITDEDNHEFTFTFSQSGSFYKLNAGMLPAGNYRYVASANNGTQVLKETGEFSVKPLQLEWLNTTADHRLLYQMATENNGAMFTPSQLNTLVETIKSRKEIGPITYENKITSDLINYRWILALLIGLFGMEWLLRKRAGTY